MIAEILCVGTELLMGQVLNTNAQYIARRLAAQGVSIYHQQVVGDNEQRLEEAYRLALSRADVVITSGGLGPTVDDITKRTAAKVLGKELVLNEEAYRMVCERFQQYHRKMTLNNQSQAMFTADTQILPNPNGTAPGAIVPAGEGKVIIHLPGPPHELEPMFHDQVEPWIQARSGHVLVSRYIRIFGMGESEVDMRLKDMEVRDNPTLSPYCSLGEVILRATARAEDAQTAAAMLEPVISEIRSRLGRVIYDVRTDDGGSLAETAVHTLRDKGWTIATAVPEETIARCNVVSEEVACAMAKSAREQLDVDIAVSATGLAGPDGGTPERPVGTVFLGIATRERVYAVPLHLSGNRARIRTLTVKHALHAVTREIKGEMEG